MPTLPIAASTIAAQAFRFAEMGPISSFADETEQAQAAAEQYPDAISICLETADWSFASVMVSLPSKELAETQAADPDLPYSYGLPGDLIRLREVMDECTRWRIDLDLLRADRPAPLRIRYTARITNEARLPATFRKAVALQLAILLAPTYLRTQSKIQQLESQFRDTLEMAQRQDARMASTERYDGLTDQSDWASEAVQ